MEKVREQLLELVRSSLWGTEPSKELFDEQTPWQQLLSEAHRQAVTGSIYTQLEGLEHKPPKAAMMRLHTLTTLNRKMYLRQLQALKVIMERLKAHGIERPVLLKGVGVSSTYLDPGVRQCGDIDLYVGKENYIKALEILRGYDDCKVEGGSISHKHFHVEFDSIPIEIHRIVISANNISRNRSQFSAWCSESLEGDELRHETIEGVEVYLPPYNFDAIYIFYHAWNHFCTYGIAYRQICDWCRYLSTNQEKIDKERLAQDIERFGLKNPWNFFASTAVKHLGLDESLLAAYEKERNWKTEKVTERIWVGGNFGSYNDKNAMGENKNVLRRKFINFFSLFHSYAFLRTIDKRYALNFLLRGPLNSIRANILQVYYSLSNK